MIPARFAPVAFGFVLSGLMSFVVAGIGTCRTAGLSEDSLGTWIGAWLLSWLIAFPVVLVVAQVVRRLVNNLVKT